ncbi:MAG: alpha-galactosidase [Myxococcales bacterium]|nr:alpha-galactosidase [Myxococcales bacterium]
MTLRAVLLVLGLAALGCGDDSEPEAKPCTGSLELDVTGVVLADDCESRFTLSPRVKSAGSWQGPSADCALDAGVLVCPLGGLGSARVELDGSVVKLGFSASADSVVQGLALEGEGELDGATGWLSNGFQSWSQSGVVALGPPPSDAKLEKALAARGDGEVVREGSELSWSYTFAGGGASSLFAGALSEQRFRAWAALHRDGDLLRLRLVSGASGEAVAVAANGKLAAEPWQLELGSDLEGAARRWADAIPSRARSTPRPASAGWNSWYELWDEVDETAVRENAPLAREILTPILPSGTPLRIVVDDGWQQAWGDWEPNAKFPSGLSGLAKDLKAEGFQTGVWLAPLLVDEDSATAQAHPEWMVGGASFEHSKNGKMFVLDVTHPEAAKHLGQVIAQIVGWGYDLLKIDFLFAGTFEGQRAEPVTPMEAYARALQIIREAAGEDTLLLAVGSPGLASLPFVDGWRVGGDIAFQVSDVAWAFLPSQARSVAARWPLCRATVCDADPVLLRKLEQHEVDAGGYIAAFAGGALFLSDDLRKLPGERRSWGLDAERAAWAISKAPAVPEDPFPKEPPEALANVVMDLISKQTSHVVPSVWKSEDGAEILLNVSDEPRSIRGVEVGAHSAKVR